MSIEISKAFLHKTKNGDGLTLTFKRSNQGDETEVVEKHKAPIHKDLKTALNALEIHLAVMTDYVSPAGVEIAAPDPELTEKFHVHGYSIGGGEDSRGVILSGHLILKNGLAHNFNTPFFKFEQPETSRYTFMDDLIARINVIESEIAEYLDGKRGELAEPELAFPKEEEKENGQQKKRSRKKAAGFV